MSLSQRRALIDTAASASIRQQCQWMSLARSAYYYQPIKAQAEDLLFMRLLDEQYLQTPQYGYRKMQVVLLEAGYCVNHKRVRRLMQTLGIEAIYPKVNTSKPAIGHRIYPYLLGGLVILRVHQVWATDITYVPMATGYMYLIRTDFYDLNKRERIFFVIISVLPNAGENTQYQFITDIIQHQHLVRSFFNFSLVVGFELPTMLDSPHGT